MTKQSPDGGLSALLTWPALPDKVVLSAQRVDVTGRQQIWFVDESESGYTLGSAVRTPSGEWSSFSTGEPYNDAIAAAQSDEHLISLRSDEITIYKMVISEESSLNGHHLHGLSEVLTCVGLESPEPNDWPQAIGSFWSASDSELESAYDGFECTPRWAFANELRVSCIRFEDVTPPDLIPVLFDQGDQWSDLDTWGTVADAGYSEDDTMGRPFSSSGQMTLIRFRPGYAISLHEADADVVAGSSYLTRFPLDPAEEAATINAWQAEMDEATFANYQEDDSEEGDDDKAGEEVNPTVP